uniref:Cilia- and flagella-associated protein 263 n=1 Tax=Mastacembelus armatus TaxID=205130 RepID=A0A7N8YME5_9TELE
MFERFIGRQRPRDLVSQGHGRRRRSRSYIPDRLLQLTLEQKLYVAQTEVTETQQDQEKLKQRYESIQDNYKASLKEAELRLTEIRKARKEFERRLLKSTKDNRLQMKEPEKVLQYIIDKLKVKLETDDIFSVILSSLSYVCKQEKLQNITWESTELSNDITNRKQMLMKIEEEIQHAEEDRLKAEALNQHLCHQMANFQAPDIIDYIRVKERHKKLLQSIHTWERKVGIAEVNQHFDFLTQIHLRLYWIT